MAQTIWDTARAELAEYFRHEDLGPPSLPVEPRAGTTSPVETPPRWPPGCDPVLMTLVYRRLGKAQEAFGARTGLNILAVLRVRYGYAAPRSRGAAAQEKASRSKKAQGVIDSAEACYVEARDAYQRERGIDRERRRLAAMEHRAFGGEIPRWVSDD